MDFVYELLRAGTTQADSDSGAEVARKINDNFSKVKDKFAELEKTAVTEVVINGVSQSINGGKLDIPVGGSEQAGLVKSSDNENNVSIKSDGTMEITSITIDKLVQKENQFIILDENN